jgi:subtilisin family serine protease
VEPVPLPLTGTQSSNVRTARQELEGALAGLTLSEATPAATEHFVFRVTLRSTNLRQIRQALEGRGAEVVERLASGVLLVRMTEETVQEVQNLPEIQSIEPQLASRKMDTQLRQTLTQSRQNFQTADPRSNAVSSESIPVEIRLFPGASTGRIGQLLKAQRGRIERETRTAHLQKIEATLSPATLERVAALPEVASIEPRVPHQLFNDQAAAILEVPTVVNATGLTGQGQIVGHADSGLDLGTTGPTLHPDFQGQIAAAFALGRPDDWSDPAGHGTRTAGSIVGLGTSSGGLYKGLAPGARLVHQSLLDSASTLSGIPADYGDLFEQAYQAGARVHSDSWGAETRGAYTRSAELDAWAWNDGKPRDMLVVVAVGNSGPTSTTIASPATAKNCLAVGASENTRPQLGANADNPDELASFSARGPVAGERIRPDVVAPGTWILSTNTRADYTPVDDPMETGLGNWTPQPAGSWKLTDADAHSPSYCWSDSPISGYANNQDSLLISPVFDGTRARTIRFWARWSHAESNGYGFYLYFNRGNGWETNRGRYYEFSQRNSRWPEWERISVTIPSAFSESPNLQCAFRLRTDSTGTDDGIFLDDVQISSAECWGNLSEFNLAETSSTLDTNYAFGGGTSAATPVAAAAAALVREYCEKTLKTNPSAELVKALLLNGAVPLDANRVRPDENWGWGRLDVARSLGLDDPARHLFYRQETGLTENESRIFGFRVTDSSQPLRATLTWCDPPGESLQNDLDLTLLSPSGKRYCASAARPLFAPQQTLIESFPQLKKLWPVDLDKDGDTDLVGWGNSETLAWWERLADGTYQEHLIMGNPLPTFDPIPFIELWDLEGDGDSDFFLIGPDDKLYAIVQNSPLHFTLQPLWPSLSFGSTPLALARLDEDADCDLIRAAGNTLILTENQGRSFSVSHTIGTLPTDITQIQTVDLNGDGLADILCSAQTGLFCFLNSVDGVFTFHAIGNADQPVTQFLATPHLDRTGHTGVTFLVENTTTTLVQTAYWDHDRFTISNAWRDPNGSVSLRAVGDLNRDGLADLVVERPNQMDPLQVLVNTGGGTFRWPTPITASFTPEAHYALADLDGDSFSDLLAFASNFPAAVWWPQNQNRDWLNNVEGIDIAQPETGVWHSEVVAQSLFSATQPCAQVFTGALQSACRLTVQNPTGPYTPSSPHYYEPDVSISLTAPARVNGPEGVRFLCQGWMLQTSTHTLQGTTTPVVFTLDGDTTLTWRWIAQYQLTALADPFDAGSVTPPKVWVTEGQTVSFQATPKTGWHLAYWNESPDLSQNPMISAPITQPGPITAHFAETSGPPTFFPQDWDTAARDALRFLLTRQNATTGFLDSYTSDDLSRAELADQAIALIALTHEASTSPSLARAADRLAQALIAAQRPPALTGAPADARYWPAAWNTDTAAPLDSTLRTEENAWAAYALLYYAATLESDTAPQARQAAVRFTLTALACLRRPNGFDFTDTDSSARHYSPAPNLALCWLFWNIGGLGRYPAPVTQAPRSLDWWAGQLYQTLMIPNRYRQTASGSWQSDAVYSTSAQAYGAIVNNYAGQADLARQTLQFLMETDNCLLHTEYNYPTSFYGLRNLTGLEDATLYGVFPLQATLKIIPAPPPSSSEQTLWNVGTAQVICASRAVDKAPSATDLFNSLLATEYGEGNLRAWPQSVETFSDSTGAHRGPQEWGLHVGATAWTYCAIRTVQGDRVPFDPSLRRYALRLHANGGTVQVTPARDAYPLGTTVQIQAIPTSDRPFIGWTGDASGAQNPLEITLDRDLDITALFYSNWAGWRVY